MLAVACVGSTLPVYLTAAWTRVFTLMSALAYLPEVPIYWPMLLDRGGETTLSMRNILFASNT